jgi:hypothetical protein
MPTLECLPTRAAPRCIKQLPYTATKQVTFDALLDAAARSPLLPRGASTLAAAALQHGQNGSSRQKTHRLDSGGAGHLRPGAPSPSRLRTAALWSPEQCFGRLGLAVPPWSPSESPPETLVSLHPTIQATAAVLSTLASQPGDAILSEVNAGSGADRSVGGAVKQLGASGLARGLQARLVHVGLIVTVQLILYDQLKHAFGVP